MSPSNGKVAAGAFLLAALAVISVDVLAHPAPPAEKTAKERQALAETKKRAAQKAYDQLFEAYRHGQAPLPNYETVYLWSRRCLEADLDVSDKPADRTAAYELHLTRMKEMRTQARDAGDKTGTGAARLLAADYYCAEGEVWLARAASQ